MICGNLFKEHIRANHVRSAVRVFHPSQYDGAAVLFDAERFIAQIIPQGDNKFTWLVNLSGLTQESIDMIVEGRKSNPTIYIDETEEDEDDSSSVHNKKRRKSAHEEVCKGEKYSLTATPHRLQSLTNNKKYSFL